tara:strand:+ start:6158 stop:7927 length:1770 start_codon:yes stop_codon:yes gene_type:complete
MKQQDKSSFTGLLLMAAILIIFNVFVFNKDTETISKSENINNFNEENLSENNSENKLINKESFQKITEKEENYILENNKIILEFSNKGGKITSAKIKNYYSYNEYNKHSKDLNYIRQPIEIFNGEDSDFIINGNRNINTNTLFNVIEEKNRITFEKKYSEQSFIRFIYTLNDDKENFLNLSIESNGIENPELTWTIAAPHTEKSKTNQEQFTGFYYQEEYSGDVDYTWDNKSFEVNEFNTELNWIAFKQQFFSTIINAENNKFNSDTEFKVTLDEEDKYVKTLSLRTNIKDGESKYSIYFGPNDYNLFSSYENGYVEIFPLGFMGIDTFVNKYIIIKLFNFLRNTSGITNFGLIILILTILIKLTLSPLTYKSYLSQAKMKVLKPEIDKATEKYKEKDPLKAQQETMNLYRKAGVSPMGGCLPMLIQFPILIAMFRFFPASLDMRHKSFLWADDLSSYDSILELGFNIPFYGDHISLFTLLMCLSTLMYTHMNSQMTSAQMPGMKWMMYLMPVMFLGFFNNYASSLTYYYFLANIFTFFQMYLMKRFVNNEVLLAQIEENKKKPRKKSKFQKKLEELQKKQEQKMKRRK